MSHISGPGDNRVHIVNQAAQQAARARHATVSPATVRATAHIPRATLVQVVEELVQAPPTDDELRLLTEVAREAEEQSLPPEQIEARLRDTRLWQLLSVLAKNDLRIVAYLGLLIAIIHLFVDLNPPNPPAPGVTVNVTVPIDEIVIEIEKRLEHEQPPESPPIPPQQLP